MKTCRLCNSFCQQEDNDVLRGTVLTKAWKWQGANVHLQFVVPDALSIISLQPIGPKNQQVVCVT
jgi:hypothetical protein